MNLPIKSGPKLSRGQAFSTASFLIAALAVVPGTAAAQQAYFSFEGDFGTAGDELDFLFALDPAVSSPATMRFETFASSGGTNAAGNAIADGPGDSVLRLLNSSGVLIAEDDDRAVLSRDALISFSDGDTPLPSPLGVDNYRLNLSDFDDDTDPYAVDLVAPVDEFTLLSVRRNVNSLAVIDSLALGTSGAGLNQATFLNTTDLTIDGPLVIGQTGQGLFEQLTGTTTVTGTTTINRFDRLGIQSGAAFTANGPIVVNEGSIVLISGSTLNINDGLTMNDGFFTFDNAAYNSTVNVNSGGRMEGNLAFIASSVGSSGDVTVTGAFSLFLASGGGLRVGERGDGTLTVADGGTLGSANATIGTFAGATGDVTVTGAGSIWSNAGPLFVGGSFTNPGGTGTLTVEAGGEVTSDDDVTVYSPGTININTGGVFNANGDVNVNGGTINRMGDGFNLAAGRTLTASADAQITFTGAYDITDGTTFNLTDGADWSLTSDLDVGIATDGTLVVDGSGTTLTTGTSSPFTFSIGFSGATGAVTVRNDATATINDVLNVGRGTLDIESGADLILNARLELARVSFDTVGTLNVTGSGSTFTQNGTDPINIGRVASSAASSGTLNIADGATFTTAAGTTTVNATGTINVDTTVVGSGFSTKSELVLNGDLVVEAGGLVTLDAGQIVAGTTPGATFTNRGTFRPRSVGALGGNGSSSLSLSGPVVRVPYVQEAGGTLEIGPAAGDGSFIPRLTTLFQNADYTLAGELSLIADRSGDPLTDFGFLMPYDSPEELISNFGLTSTRTGIFDTVTGHILGDGTALAVTYNPGDVEVQRVLFGDGNLDGFISQPDLDAVLLAWGMSNLNGNNDDVSWVTGDYDGNGFIGQGDLDGVLLNWGNGTPPTVNLLAIPEPSTVTAIALLSLVGLRRRH